MQWSIFCSGISGVADVRAGRLSNGGGERRRRNGEWACIGVSGAGGIVWSGCHTGGRGAGVSLALGRRLSDCDSGRRGFGVRGSRGRFLSVFLTGS